VVAEIVIPKGFELPRCDHPIEKWCKNCDFDYDTYERIPHFRKYSSLTFFDDKGNVIE
jgi:hypothetical protein